MSAKRPIVLLLILGGSFAILLFSIRHGYTDAVDADLRGWALGTNTPTSLAIWKAVTVMGSVAVISSLTFLSLGLFIVQKNWFAARRLSLAMGGAVVLELSIKWIVQRPRPDEVYLNTMPTSSSFPSGHALYSFAFYLTIATIISRSNFGSWRNGSWIAAILIVAAIGASRIFLGVHYGSDVLGGYLIAATWLTAFPIWTHNNLVESV